MSEVEAAIPTAASARRWGPTPQQHVHALPLPHHRHRGLHAVPLDAPWRSVAHTAAVAHAGDVTAHAQPDKFAAGAGTWGLEMIDVEVS